jgi:ketosteroid isomerase-like protein
MAALALLVLGVAPGVCQASGPEAEVRGILDRQEAAWNRADVVSFMEGYEKSPELTFSGASGVTRGWQNVLERYRKRYPDEQAMGQLHFTEIEVRLVGSEAALVLGRFNLKRAEKAGGNASGYFSLVFRKTPAGWRIIHDHTS